MNAHTIPDLRCAMSREAIIGHETSWKVSTFGVAQYRHGYDPALLAAIEEAALKLKASHAVDCGQRLIQDFVHGFVARGADAQRFDI